MSTYTICGGCGATHPNERCIGCLHYFGSGSWDTRKMFELDVDAGAQRAIETSIDRKPVQRSVRSA